MIKLIDLLKEALLSSHYSDRKNDRINNIKDIIVDKEG